MTWPTRGDENDSLETTPPMEHIRLYIAGSTPTSQRAQKNLRAAVDVITEAGLPNIEVIDVFEGPKRAIADGIFVTPTLVSQSSGKRMMMVGDLSDAMALGLILQATLKERR